MSAETLKIYALNVESQARHTNLTRARGELAELPPLADWLGVAELDFREVELFPLEDLGDMPLSDYVTRAYGPTEAIAAGTANRLDALSGSVLIVPGRALQDTPAPGAELTEIAALALAEADHDAQLPKADLTRPEPARTSDDRKPEKSSRFAIVVLLGVLVLAALGILTGAFG
jgi:hypothetical protein